MLVTKLRPVLVAVTFGAAVLGLTTPAYAAGTSKGTVVTVPHVGYSDAYAYTKTSKESTFHPVGTFGIKFEGETDPRLAYCIDIEHSLDKGKTYVEADWAKATHIKPAENLEKINWILHNSVPTKKAPDVLAKAEAAAPASLPVGKQDYLVRAGTQLAIWHYSDGLDLLDYPVGQKPPGTGEMFNAGDFAVVKKVYNYLLQVGAANPGVKTLKIDPALAAAKTGEKAGPFTVTSSVGEVTLAVTGGTAGDAQGKDITKVDNGGKFWLTGANGGEVSVQATGTGVTEIGRVFVREGAADEKQKIIIPGTKTETLTATAKATFAGGPTLPVTGAAAAGIAGTGAVLLGVGSGLVLLHRRRKTTFAA